MVDKKEGGDVDFGEALTLLNVITQFGQHGPAYQKFVAAAQARLKEIERSFGDPLPADEEVRTHRTVMPAAGGDPIPVDEDGNPIVYEQEGGEDPVDPEVPDDRQKQGRYTQGLENRVPRNAPVDTVDTDGDNVPDTPYKPNPTIGAPNDTPDVRRR